MSFFSFLSTRQRAVLVPCLIAASPVATAIGSYAGWSAGLSLSVSVGFSALAAFVFLDGMSALGQFSGGLKNAIGRMAEGDLTQDIDGGATETGAILQSLQGLQLGLRDAFGQIRSGADSLTTAASEIASGGQDLSVRTEQAASNLQQAASAMEQVNYTVKTTAESARTANQLAANAADTARRGGEVVGEVVNNMRDISDSSRKIADIIGVIDGIAFQTNILALNAAVEAARAGEQGRGFAVVASEVRSLAGRSAQAAREIKSLIGASVDKVESGARLVESAGATMQDIVGSVRRVSDIIGEITAATTEQSEGIEAVNGAVSQLDQMTQQNAALVEESAAAAESLKEHAGRLSDVVKHYRTPGGLGHASSSPVTYAAATRNPPAPAKPAAKASQVPAPVRASAPAPAARAPQPVATATAAGDTEWESF